MKKKQPYSASLRPNFNNKNHNKGNAAILRVPEDFPLHSREEAREYMKKRYLEGVSLNDIKGMEIMFKLFYPADKNDHSNGDFLAAETWTTRAPQPKD